MSDIIKIVLTAAATALVGIFLLVAGELIRRAFIEPLNAQAAIIVEIAEALVYYGNAFTNFLVIQYPVALSEGNRPIPPEEQRVIDASDTMRRLAARLIARNRTIPWYNFWRKLRFGPSRACIQEAHACLIGLSNSTPPRDSNAIQQNNDWIREINFLFGIVPEKPIKVLSK